MSEPTPFVLSRMLVALRLQKGLNQSQLATMLDVSASAVNQVERGRALRENVFARYSVPLGFDSELDALEAGCAALRAADRAAAPAPTKKARPAARAAKPAAKPVKKKPRGRA